MVYTHAKVELDKLPENVRDGILHLAKKHNALVDGANDIKQDIDRITGRTEEEKAEMHTLFGQVRTVFKWVHNKRFDATLGTLWVVGATFVLKWLGVSGDRLADWLDRLLKILEHFAGVV